MNQIARPQQVQVIVVNSNGRQQLADGLPSLLATRHANFQVTICDNGSTDGCLTWLRRLPWHRWMPWPAAKCGVRETVSYGTTCFLINHDPVLFAQSLERLLFDPRLRSQLGAVVTGYVREQWTWTKAVDELKSQIQQVLAEPNRQIKAIRYNP